MASVSNQQNLSLQQKKEKLLSNTGNNDNTNNKKKYKRRKYCWFISGIIVLLFCIQLTFVPHLINKAIKNGIIDAFIFSRPCPDNSHYQSWLSNKGGVPVTYHVQFFNVTNPDKVLLGEMPKLNLTAPIVYDYYFSRRDVDFSDNGEYVNYTFFTEYIYNSKLSEISPLTNLTILSPLVGTLYHKWNVSKKIERSGMQEIMKIFEEDPHLLFWSDTAANLIWTIYDFPKLNYSYGFMRNASNQYYILHTGHNDNKRMGEVQRWCREPLTRECLQNDSSKYIDAWNPAMPISPGHLFYEGVYRLTHLHDNNKNNIPPLWVAILFRNIYLVYNKTYDFKGIELYKYGIQFDPQLLNTSLYPPNAQYNQFGPSGILNSSAAYSDISIFLSMVLFFGAPDYLENNTKIGIPKPGPFDYPYIDIEPKTGAVFYANASMQISTLMHSLPNINNITINPNKSNLFNLTDDMMIPLWLVTFSDEVTNDLANNFKRNINLGKAMHIVSIVVGWISVVFLLIWCFITVFLGGVYYHRYKMQNIN